MKNMAIDQAELEKRAMQLVEAARKAGADASDAIAATGVEFGVDVWDGKAVETERAESNGLALRVFVGKRVASVLTNQADEVNDLAERAVLMARATPENEYAGLADRGSLATELPQLDLFDQTEVTATMLAERAIAAEEAGLSVKGVSKSNGASAAWSVSGLVLATSHGFVGSYQRTRHGISMSAIADDGTGMERDFDSDQRTHLSDLEPPETIGKRAGERVVRKLKPRKPESSTGTVVYEPRTARSLVASFSSAINGEAIVKGRSFLKDKLNSQVFSPKITIIDNPCEVRGAGSKPFDGEGVGLEPMELVSKGELLNWMLDSATARELGLKTNGRAARKGSTLSPSSTNLIVEIGDKSPDELISGVNCGLYVTELIGRGVNAITGDYSRGASGFWIENGEIAYPVSEITIADNLVGMFNRLSAANDRDDRTSIRTPTLAVEGMTIGGR